MQVVLNKVQQRSLFCTKGSQCIMGDVGEGNARMLDSARLERKKLRVRVYCFI